MTEDEKMQVAVFRFGIISDFVTGGQMGRTEKSRLMREKCSRKWQIPFSEKTRISRGTILRWIRVYTAGNNDLKTLFPKGRNDKGGQRAMDEETCLALMELRKTLPDATVPRLIEEMEKQKRALPGILNKSTVYRFLHQADMMRPKVTQEDRRRFEAELPNDLWQSDVMHGPSVNVDGRLRKAYLIAIIDDHSRLIVHARFYLSETLSSWLDAFENALARRGLPRKLYVDNGAAFRSRQLEYISASLAIHLIHARPYSPQGKGKIERFFKTVRTRFLPGCTAETLTALNDALDRWIHDDYHHTKHSSTGQTPLQRFTANIHCLRTAPQNLKDHFRQVARRTISSDRTITLDGKLYEGPVALIGKRVELLYHENDTETIEVKYQNKSYGVIRPVDIHVNCRVKRDKNNQPQLNQETGSACQSGALFDGMGQDE